jgi:MFS transporter, YNFM family, putative membrane transport protein
MRLWSNYLSAASARLVLRSLAVSFLPPPIYMLHNTLQTKATQMTPQARGTAVGLFSSALYIGQTAGVAAGALVIDRAGARPLFLATAAALPALALWFVSALKRHRQVA